MRAHYIVTGMIILLLIFAAVTATAIVPASNTTPSGIFTVERDTIRSTNLWSSNEALVINHEIFLLNNLNHTINVNFSSFIPREKAKRCKTYPAFGSNALLDFPLFVPAFIKGRVKNVTWLDNLPYGAPPGVNITNTETGLIYHYDNVTIEPGTAVIAVYENYYDNLSSIYTPYGLNTTHIAIFESYKVLHSGTNQTVFNLNYELENTGDVPIYGIKFGTFFPYRNITAKNCSSPNVTCTVLTMQDGNGKWKAGYLCSLYLHYLGPGSDYRYALNFTVVVPSQTTLRPLLIITYPTERVSGTEKRIWQPWELNIEGVNRTRYYTMVSMVVPDRFNLSIKDVSDQTAVTATPTGTTTPDFNTGTVIIGLLIAVVLLLNKKKKNKGKNYW